MAYDVRRRTDNTRAYGTLVVPTHDRQLDATSDQ
jgi:hypothetical protein